MATMRKRSAKGLPPGQDPAGYEEGGAAAERAPSKIAQAQKKASVDNPTPARRRKPEGFDEQLIRERAYAIWIEEGQPDGRDVEHWIKARVEIEREAA